MVFRLVYCHPVCGRLLITLYHICNILGGGAWRTSFHSLPPASAGRTGQIGPRTEKGKTAVENAGMLFHTDRDIEDLASAIGVTIDWSKIE